MTFDSEAQNPIKARLGLKAMWRDEKLLPFMLRSDLYKQNEGKSLVGTHHLTLTTSSKSTTVLIVGLSQRCRWGLRQGASSLNVDPGKPNSRVDRTRGSRNTGKETSGMLVFISSKALEI
ncbi:hypothetical protein PoB_001713900 [Plakobranchus ocellatus]|uniref:Uncharacterized protein n=1 Tax=Plakobranchus ocellatus TaxID=259542 RepID=A0AAV3Z895_9GAST|nr:hypothetical protein PoB_001713900 [Plakobranchus ocellatus]